MTLGKKIQDLRQKKSLSQKELAIKINKSTGDVALWESDELTPSVADIAKLSAILGVTTDSLIVEAEVPQEQGAQTASEVIPQSTPVPIKPKKRLKRNLAIFIPIGAIAVVLIGVLSFFLLLPFSKNTMAIEQATASVVKIYCYDYEGNQSATGSGFIAYTDQTVITNYHVMAEAYTCKISTEEDKTYEVESIIAYSKEQDLAIIKLVEPTGLKVLKIGDSAKIKKGETVTAIGSPLGLKNTVSQGILSGRLMKNDMDVLQFTAAISSGSSGGALFDERGNVIGVTYASYVDGQNLNLAIPGELVDILYIEGVLNKEPFGVSEIYSVEHPYLATLTKFPNAIEVTFENLKNNPSLYDGKIIKINVYVSSMKHYSSFPRYNFCDNENNVSGNYDKDSEISSNYKIPYKNCPIIHNSLSSSLLFVDENLNVGDNVIVIGTFVYYSAGEDLGYDLTSPRDQAVIDVDIIYKG